MTRTTQLPYERFSDIRIRSSEPMSYAYFNSHIMRLCANLDAMDVSHTLQKATYEQWGTVRFATVDDILNESGDKTAVMTNNVLNDAMDKMRSDNIRSVMTKGRMDFTKNYEFVRGEFIVGVNERVAKKVTDYPDRVVYSNVTFVPLGFESTPFHTARTDTVAASAFENDVHSSGILNFVDWNKPEEFRDFHIYYHKSGYIICNNGKYDDSQRQLKVVWTLMMRKDNL